MSTSETIARAALNRLKARLSKKFSKSIAETIILMKDAPEIIQKEWEIFKEEIAIEATKLDEIENKNESYQENGLEKEDIDQDQNTIDKIRLKISQLTNQIEEIN